MKVLIAGGAGFIGSHLTEALLDRDDDVIVFDDMSTGQRRNLASMGDHPRLTVVDHDVCRGVPLEEDVDAVLNLASPASPRDYLAFPLETLDAGALGTRWLLEYALERDATFLLASTSEVYGDPTVNPQPESYWGNVNPVGPRSVYDESKRFAEALTEAYHREERLDVRIARIFNTYGPRMRPFDGRVVSNFLHQAARGDPLTVYGDGSQTRSFCYVDDMVRGLTTLLEDGDARPVNLGNPEEVRIIDLAERVLEVTGAASNIIFKPLPKDDPKVRRPDIRRARDLLAWEPRVPLDEGLARTWQHVQESIRDLPTAAATAPEVRA